MVIKLKDGDVVVELFKDIAPKAVERFLTLSREKKYDGVELHLLGPLQRNKVRQAMNLFDYIHTVDNFKLVKKIAEIRDEISFCPKIFIQVNIGNEQQKAGRISNLKPIS